MTKFEYSPIQVLCLPNLQGKKTVWCTNLNVDQSNRHGIKCRGRPQPLAPFRGAGACAPELLRAGPPHRVLRLHLPGLPGLLPQQDPPGANCELRTASGPQRRSSLPWGCVRSVGSKVENWWVPLMGNGSVRKAGQLREKLQICRCHVFSGGFKGRLEAPMMQLLLGG